jgi:general secretion pathway protein I
LVETTRAILTELPDREQLVSGSLRGEFANHPWQVDIVPFVADFIDPRRPGLWMPQTVVVNVRSPSGRVLRIDTVRLHHEQGSKK